jgi:hypothetical protein
MFFTLIVVVNGHLRSDAFTFRNGSGTGMSGTGLKIDDTKLGPNSTDAIAQDNPDIGELAESKVNGTNFWNMFDDPIEQTNRTDSTQTEEDRAIHQNRFDWDRNLTREDFCGKLEHGEHSGSASPSNISARSYIIHVSCPSVFGVGATVLRVTNMLDIAESQNLTMVCQPEDWGSLEHHTGNVGGLFGCFSSSSAEGNLATLDNVCNDPSLVWESVYVHETGHNGTNVQQHKISEPIKQNRVYAVNTGHPCNLMRAWGKSWRFLESQYHLIREKDAQRTNSSSVSGFSIVVHIRRGDGVNRGYKPSVYTSSVDALLQLSSGDNSTETRISKLSEGQSIERLRQTFGVVDNRTVTISVLAEESNRSKDAEEIMAQFEKLTEKYKGKISETRYFFGQPEKHPKVAKARWVHDTDVAATSDLLILSPSYYSALLAALQRKKRAFTIPKVVKISISPE